MAETSHQGTVVPFDLWPKGCAIRWPASIGAMTAAAPENLRRPELPA